MVDDIIDVPRRMPSGSHLLQQANQSDPLEVLAEVLHVAHHLRADGHQPLQWVRSELDFLINQMCPICGRVRQHEDADHRFVPARR